MIDPRAIVDPSARIGENVEIGPWSIIGPDVTLGDNTIINSHVIVRGPTTIGAGNRIFQFATVGESTPDLKYRNEPTRLVIGDNNTIREGVTIHRGTTQDRGETTIGSNNLLMAYVHIGHDCVVGDNCILVNNASLSGHVTVGDWAILSGYTLVHQFVSIGAHCFTGAATYLTQDVPPYVLVAGNPAAARKINSEGLRRRGFTADQLQSLSRAYRTLYRQGLQLDEALGILEEKGRDEPVVGKMAEFIRASRRGIVR